MSVLVRSMRGLGDNIYQRAFVANMGAVFIDTPWPELYADLPVQFVRPNTTLRTQRKNVLRQRADRWVQAPHDARSVHISYGHRELSRSSIPQAMRAQFGVAPTWSLPTLPSCPVGTTRPLAVLRPATVRAEWRNEARNPLPEYLAEAADELLERGYYVVSVADLEDGQEWILPPVPRADQQLHYGELGVLELLSLVAHARVCVGGVGWILPACVAARTPLYVVQGGNGAHNARERLTDQTMDISRIGWAKPRSYCRCASKMHRCNKVIPDFRAGFRRWLDGQRL